MSSGNLPENKHPTAWYLFNVRFMCGVPFIHTMSVDYIKHFGVPATGIPEYDRGSANEQVVTMLTINAMVEYYKKSVPVRVKKPSDTKIIYEHITNHLLAWKSNLENSLNIRSAPIDDLLVLDQFANVVYEHAKYHFDKEFVESLLTRRMMNASRINRDNILKRPTEITRIRPIDDSSDAGEAEQREEVPQHPQRQSMADIFSERKLVSAGKFKWK